MPAKEHRSAGMQRDM